MLTRATRTIKDSLHSVMLEQAAKEILDTPIWKLAELRMKEVIGFSEL